MKPFSIFRVGKHTPMQGTAIEFDATALKAAVAAYDPAKHEAPLVVGHPKDNGPAYGWVAGMSFNEETNEIMVSVKDVENEFSDMVEKRRFPKRSASWYTPDHPNNPTPGTWHLRHVGFLGAMPPAIKGLKDVAFAEEPGSTFEFADKWTWRTLASMIRNLREKLIEKEGIEEADKVFPTYAISELEAAANAPDSTTVPAYPAYSEEDDMDLKQAQARITELEATNTTQAASITALQGQVAKVENFAEREATITSREAALTAREQAAQKVLVTNRIDNLIKAGKVLPAQKDNIVAFAMSLADADTTFEFGEKKEKVTQRDSYLRTLEAGATLVDFKEHSQEDGARLEGKEVDPVALGERVRAKVAEASKNGKTMDYTEAAALAMVEMQAE